MPFDMSAAFAADSPRISNSGLGFWGLRASGLEYAGLGQGLGFWILRVEGSGFRSLKGFRGLGFTV